MAANYTGKVWEWGLRGISISYRQNTVSNRFTVNELQALKACFEDAIYFKKMPDELTREGVIGILSGGLLFEAIERILDIVIENTTSEIEGFFELNDSSFLVNIVEV